MTFYRLPEINHQKSVNAFLWGRSSKVNAGFGITALNIPIKRNISSR
jgi:hypothetical protein